MYEFTLTDPQFLPHSGCEIQFSLKPGHVLCVMGENGIGKTTLVRRFWHEFEHQSISYTPQSQLEIFYDRNLAKFRELFLQAGNLHIDVLKFEKLWVDFGLSQKGDRSLSTLSGGEAQCLKLITGLCLRREVFVLDEPSQYLDQNKIQILRRWLDDLLAENKAILLVEHDRSWMSDSWQILELKNLDGLIRRVE